MADVLRATAMFWGDGEQEGENPQDFMNGLKLAFMQKAAAVDEANKIKTFLLKLKVGSMAKEWFNGLKATEKDTWAHLQTAFEERWPEKTAPAKTREEKQTELKQAVLKEGQLGKKEKVNGVDEWSHIAWADRVQQLAGAIPDTHGLLIGETREKMPTVLRRLINAEHITWLTFCDAVRKISLTKLCKAIEFESRLVTKDDLERVQLQTPSKGLARAMQSTTLGPRIAQPNFQPAPFQAQLQPAAPMGLLNNPNRLLLMQSFRPDAERLPDLVRLALPIHPNTAAGRVLYMAQIVAYLAMSNGRGPNEFRPHPLSPGTNPVTSGECWTCGFTGHMRAACVGTPIPQLEQKWRSLAASIKSWATAAASSMNLVEAGADGGGEFVS